MPPHCTENALRLPRGIMSVAGDDDGPWAEDLLLAGGWSSDGRHVVLGVDGGATSTVCVALECTESTDTRADGCTDGSDGRPEDEENRIVGRGVAGCSNSNSVGETAARRALEDAMAAALTAGSLPRAAVRSVCLCLAGVDRPDDVSMVTRWMRDIFAHDPQIRVHNDAIAALASGTEGTMYGAVLIAGTGTIAYGVGEGGREERASGGGPVFGDRGSAYAIAVEGLSAVMRAEDGRGPPTLLHKEILGHLGLSSAQELIGWAYKDSQWGRIAALTPIVKFCAARKDFEAARILEESTKELALSVSAVAKKLELAGPDGTKSFPLVLVGGVLDPQNDGGCDVTRKLEENLAKMVPQAKIVRPKVEPAFGAALLAKIAYKKTLIK